MGTRRWLWISAVVAVAAAFEAPAVPPAYRVWIEANIGNKGYTLEQRDFYDGVNQRVKLVTGGQSVLELVDVGVSILWTEETCMVNRSIDFFVGLNHQIRKSNEFLGGSDEDVYVGASKARGIATERFQRNLTSPFISYSLDVEYAAESWLESTIPVRATLVGSVPGRSFSHVYEFFDFEPEVDDKDFELPFPLVFEESQVVRKYTCNATAFADDDVVRAALEALGVAEGSTSVSSQCSSKSKKRSNDPATFVVGMFVGLGAGLVIVFGACAFCGGSRHYPWSTLGGESAADYGHPKRPLSAVEMMVDPAEASAAAV